MKQRNYLEGRTNRRGSKYLFQAFQHIPNKVDYTLRKLKSEKIEENKDDLADTWKVLKTVTN